jgi:hypothetical protein
MLTANWHEQIEKVLDPDSDEVLSFDFTNWLDGETLDAQTALVDVVGATSQVESLDATSIAFRLTAMTAGAPASVTVRAVSSPSLRKDDFTLKIVVRNK